MKVLEDFGKGAFGMGKRENENGISDQRKRRNEIHLRIKILVN